MSPGLPSSDTTVGISPPEVRALEKNQNFTPYYPHEKPTITEPPVFQEPTTTDNSQIDKLMSDIMAQGQQKKPEAVVSQVEKNIPSEAKKSQGFITQTIEWIKNLFRNLFK